MYPYKIAEKDNPLAIHAIIYDEDGFSHWCENVGKRFHPGKEFILLK